MTACEVRLYNDYTQGANKAVPALAYVEAESFDLCRAALLLSGDAVKGRDGFFYNRDGVKVVICWLNYDKEEFWKQGIVPDAIDL